MGTHTTCGAAMRSFIAMLFIAVITACMPKPAVIHEPVTVERVVYVPIDPALTRVSPVPMPRNDSGRELIRVARDRRDDLVKCYADKAEIARIQGTPLSPEQAMAEQAVRDWIKLHEAIIEANKPR